MAPDVADLPVSAIDANRALALSLAAKGIPVFPCQSGGPEVKRPERAVMWRNVSTTDVDQVARWWDRWPTAMPGIDLKKAGLFVVDADRHGGPDGVTAWDALCEEHGFAPDEGSCCATAGGGAHFYFRQPKSTLGNARGGLPKGIDAKGAGGYVIAPGSVRADGRAYGQADVTRPMPMPAWLEAIVRGERNVASSPPPAPTTSIASTADDRRVAGYAEAAVAEELRELAAAPKGGRNNALNTASFKLGTLAGAGWISEADARGWLEDAAHQCGLVKDDGIRSVRATIRSGLASGRRQPRKLPEGDAAPAGDYGVRNWLEGGRGKSEGETPAGQAPSAIAPAQPIIVAEPLAWHDPATIPRRQWLYGRHMIRGFMSATIAAGGVGKSSLLIAEAMAMASGLDLIGGAPAGQLCVWMFNGEDPKDELDRRFAATMIQYGVTAEEIAGRLFVNSGRTTPIVLAEDARDGTRIIWPVVEALKSEIRSLGVDVLIVDPFVTSHRVSENDNRRIEDVARTWAEIAEETGCAIELVHHARKTGGAEVTVEDGRGASALIAKARSVRTLNRMSKDEAARLGVAPEDSVSLFRVDNGKANLAPPPAQADWFRMIGVGLGNGVDGDPETQDYVGVATRWQKPDLLRDITVRHLLALQREIDGKGYRKSIQSPEWIGLPIARILDIDDPRGVGKGKVAAALKMWLASGALVEIVIRDKSRRGRPTIEVGEWADE